MKKLKLIFLMLLCFSLTGCFGPKDSDDASSTTVVTTPDESQDGDDTTVSNAACDSENLQHGESSTRTRYQAAAATYGLDLCQSEEQTCSCDNGTVSCTGSYTFESCSQQFAKVTGGDILMVTEKAFYVSQYDDPYHMHTGAVIAFDKNGNYKGTVLASESPDEPSVGDSALNYVTGMKLTTDPFDRDLFYLQLHMTEEDSLDMTIWQSPTVIDPAESVALASPTEVSGVSAVSSGSYFEFGASTSRYGHGFYVGDITNDRLNYYQNNVLQSCYVDYSAYSTWNFGDIYLGIFNLNDGHVLRYNSTHWAVDKFTKCGGGGNQTPTELFSVAQAVTGRNLIHFDHLAGGGSWDDSIFVQYSAALSDASYVRYYHNGSNWVSDTSPFNNVARAMYYMDNGSYSRTIYTVEESSGTQYIRTYDGDGNLLNTLYSGDDEDPISTGFSTHMVVVPE